MSRKRGKRSTQIIAYTFSAIVALSMILSLVGPIVFSTRTPPTPTWPPTWTPWPTLTPTPAPTGTAEPLPTVAGPPLPPAPSPTVEAETVVGPTSPLVFAVAGDNGDNLEVYGRLLDTVVDDGNAFLINTGDLVDYGSRKNFEAFQALMADFPLPFYPVPGNHDRDDDGTLTHFIAYSGAPDKHYSFDAEKAHFTMSSSSTGRLSEEELAWIDADLAATEQPVKIVVTHYPPFDPDGSAHTLYGGSEAFMELMTQHDVAYVFAGHIHAYSEEARDGTVYVITGGAGASLYETDHPNAFYHYVQVTIAGTQVSTRVVRLE